MTLQGEKRGPYRPDGQKGYDWRPAFLEEYANTGMIYRACKAANVTRQAVHYRQKNDPEFAGAMWAVRYINAGRLYDKAMKLALEGTIKPIQYRGEVVAHEQKEYPELIVKLLERFDPEGFGANQADEKIDPLTKVTFLPPRGLEDNPTVGPTADAESE